MFNSITIIGAGAFGYAIAFLLSKNGHNVSLYDVNTSVLDTIESTREHPHFHQGIFLPSNVKIVREPCSADLIIMAVPSKFIRSALENVNSKIILNCSKGLEPESNARVSEMVDVEYACLSGGMVASDVTKGNPVGMDIACSDLSIANGIADLFRCETVRVRACTDVTGVELAGPFKNVVAIGAGMLQQASSMSTVGGYLTTVSKECERLAVAIGADPRTFVAGSYSWWGDLMTTCYGASRNREFGQRCVDLAPLVVYEDMQSEHKSVEGYHTAQLVYNLCQKHNVHAPILSGIKHMLHDALSVQEFMKVCMGK